MTKKVLVCDDQHDTVSLIKVILKKEGYLVSGAYSGEECLAELRKRGKKDLPDLILLDILMPGMTGWDVLKEIRREKAWNKIQIIFASVKQKEEYDKHSAERKHFSAYITKPFERKDLLAKVKEKIGSP